MKSSYKNRSSGVNYTILKGMSPDFVDFLKHDHKSALMDLNLSIAPTRNSSGSSTKSKPSDFKYQKRAVLLISASLIYKLTNLMLLIEVISKSIVLILVRFLIVSEILI